MEVTVRKAIRISAAHQLPHHPGKCKNLHGHNYLVEVWATELEHNPFSYEGMVLDFGDIEAHLQEVVGVYDHTFLNETCSWFTDDSRRQEVQTTAENLAVMWLRGMRLKNDKYTRLRVWETDDSYAEAHV